MKFTCVISESQRDRWRVQSGHGKQALSSKANMPSYGIGSEQRKGLATKSNVPGPGKYQARNPVP